MKFSYPTIFFQKLNFFALLLFVFWLPLKADYFPTIISFWIFTWLLEGNIKLKFSNFPYFSQPYAVFLFYFLLIIIGLYASIDFKDGLFHIQQKLSIAFFPIILMGSNTLIKKHYKTILLVFVLANFIASIYCLFDTFFSNLIIENGNWYIKYWSWPKFKPYSFWQLINNRMNVFAYAYLSKFMHPAYFSMYILLSIIILVDFFRKKSFKKTAHKILSVFLIAFFILMIYFLQSKAGLIAFVVSTFFIFFHEVLRKRKKRFFVIGILVLTLGSIFIISSTGMQKVSNQFVQLIKNPQTNGLEEKDTRFQTMFAATEVIEENFWFGVTPSNVTHELLKKYEIDGFKNAQKKKLNAHNQYLETFAGMGFFGFLSLMYILIYGFVFAFKKRHYLLFFILLTLSINFLFESMLNRMAGILFMMFFYSLFVFMKNPSSVNKNKEQIKQ